VILGLSTVTRRRFATGSRTSGRFTAGAATDTAILMSVQPLNGRELASLPEGERSSTVLKGYTESDVRTLDQIASPQELADRIVVLSGRWAGTYEARAEMGETELLPHRKVRLVRLLETEA